MEQFKPLDKFGKFIVEKLRDNGLDFAEGIVNSEWKAPDLLKIQQVIADLSDTQKEVFLRVVKYTIDGAMHDFLFALQEQDEVQVLVDGENVVELSDGIHGEAYTEDGWFARFSKHYSNDDITDISL